MTDPARHSRVGGNLQGGSEGILSVGVVSLPAPLWIADQARNDVTMRCIVFTLTFDSSPIKGEGDMVGVVLLLSRPVD